MIPGEPYWCPMSISRRRKGRKRSASRIVDGVGTNVAEPLVVDTFIEETIKEHFLEIVDSENRRVVTVIEVLSPDNKVSRSQGLKSFRKKRLAVMKSKSHWVEIDLLRKGRLTGSAQDEFGPHDYFVHVSPVDKRPEGVVWPILLSQRLPVISIPLREEDDDVRLDLQTVLNTVYDRAGYDLKIDYTTEPNPRLNPEATEWRISCSRKRACDHHDVDARPSYTNSPRNTVTAWPIKTTRAPSTRTLTTPPRHETWCPLSELRPSFSAQYGPRQQCAEPQTGSSSTPTLGAKNRETKSWPPGAGAAGHDHPANRELLQPADIRLQAANLFLGSDVDQEIEPITTGISDRGLNRGSQLGELTRLFHFLVDWLGRKIELDPNRAPLGGQKAAPGLEPGGLTCRERVLPPRGYAPWPGWRDHKDQLPSWE